MLSDMANEDDAQEITPGIGDDIDILDKAIRPDSEAEDEAIKHETSLSSSTP